MENKMEKDIFVLLVSKDGLTKNVLDFHFSNIEDAYMVACNYIAVVLGNLICKISSYETSKIANRYEKDIECIKKISNLIKDCKYKDAYDLFFNSNGMVFSNSLYLKIITVNKDNIQSNEFINDVKDMMLDEISDINLNIDYFENNIRISVASFLSEWIDLEEKMPLPEKIYNKILDEARKYGNEFFDTLMMFSMDSSKANCKIFRRTSEEDFTKVFTIQKNNK